MKNLSKMSKLSLFTPALFIAIVLFSCLYFIKQDYKRTYYTGKKTEIEKDAGALGMMKFFFDARKDVSTGQLNYAAMNTAFDQAHQAALSPDNKHRVGAISGTPSPLMWTCLGPTNIGGRTRAILIDKNDPTHQTLIAGGVSGGLWRSTNGGGSWDSINDNLPWMTIGCIAQDSNGAIYVGTGEGFSLFDQGVGVSSGMIGGGILKSTDDGNIWRLLTFTKPKTPYSDNSPWSYVNRIAVQPNNYQVVYAATNNGLWVSSDSGSTWVQATNANKAAIGGTVLDVKISSDGNIVVADIAGIGYYAYPSNSNNWFQTQFSEIPGSGVTKPGSILRGGSRLEFAIAPSNSNVIYVSCINGGGLFGYGGTYSGIFMTLNAVSSGNGGYWYDIGPGGSVTFDPYNSAGAQDQCDYDNTMGVYPDNSGKLLVGGTVIYSWESQFAGDTVGAWNTGVFSYGDYGNGQPGIHPDLHATVFDSHNSDVVYVGCDGGIFKSTNATKTTNVNGGIAPAPTFTPVNRNYNVTQFYSIAFPPYENTNGEGALGGTQDNGSPYLSGNLNNVNMINYRDAVGIYGGDGADAAISQLNPDIAIGSDPESEVGRTGGLSNYSYPSGMYTRTFGLCKGADIDSLYGANSGAASGPGFFVNSLALYENPYDPTTHDSMTWITNKKYDKGDTAYPLSPNGGYPFPYIVKSNLDSGVSITIQNPVISKLVEGWSTGLGVWLTMQAADLSDQIVWMPIFGPNSKNSDSMQVNPSGGAIKVMTWSPDGRELFIGTVGGTLYLLTGLGDIIDNQFCTGALYSKDESPDDVNKNTSVRCTLLKSFGQFILSIAVDPQNGNNVLVTLGNYGSANYVYYSNNALSKSPTFTSAQGNLPLFPVYGSILDVKNANGPGTWSPKMAIVATEQGIWSTLDVTTSPQKWTIDNGSYTPGGGAIANTLALAITQQTLEPYQCNNSGSIYVGTHGRGAWRSDTYLQPTGIKNITANKKNENLNIYPNPSSTQAMLQYTIPVNEDVTVVVYDISGREVNRMALKAQAEGAHTVPLEVGGLSDGVYIVSVITINSIISGRFVIAK